MSRQHELLSSNLSINPSPGLDQPRLWVRRLVIWKSPDVDPIRDVVLRPGMNIIWTPDDDGIGHGGGKTLFCRLLRYCLGEDNFAPSEQREAITAKFPEGWVGVEVILNNQLWGILRPLGIRKKHFAVKGIPLEKLIAGDHEATGLQPFIEEIESSILTPDVCGLIPTARQSSHAWSIALAWLSRDQECRFDHVLDWRSTLSESNSPASGLDKQKRLQALRALLGAITAEEQSYRKQHAYTQERTEAKEGQKGHLTWEIGRLRGKLCSDLGIDHENSFSLEDETTLFENALKRRTHPEAPFGPEELHEALQAAKAQLEIVNDEVNRLDKKKEVLEGQKPLLEKMISDLEGVYPGLSIAIDRAEQYPCPICDVPIDRVLAEGCSLSKELPDIAKCKRRFEDNQADLVNRRSALQLLKIDLSPLATALNAAREKQGAIKDQIADIEDDIQKDESEKRSHHQAESEIQRLSDLKRELVQVELHIKEAKDEEKQHLISITRSVKAQDKAVSILNEKFNPIVRYLVGQDTTAEARLTANDITLKVLLGGNRSTSAIDSLKVVAFDLAALCLSIEGAIQSPAFLIHDSPREADLGLPLYHQIFHLLQEFESAGEQPLFQYIVTTTTRPPDGLRENPWLRLELRGSPADERLLKVDL